MKYYVVDAFTDNIFAGNPAGVCVLDEVIEDNIMQKIAHENNLSETAFVMKIDNKNEYNLRWFTPEAEIDLCGHATLGSAYVICNYVDKEVEQITFHTMSGELIVTKNKDLFEMDFPCRLPKKTELTEEIVDALGITPKEIYLGRDLFVLLNNESEVQNLSPDFLKLRNLKDGLGVIVTAYGDEYDFVSRCFYPKMGVNEDPVTGSAYCNLIPFWAERLQKNKMISKQISPRGGVLHCELLDNRVKIAGKAALYMIGEIAFA